LNGKRRGGKEINGREGEGRERGRKKERGKRKGNGGILCSCDFSLEKNPRSRTKIGEDQTCSSGDIIVDRQTHRHTHTLITILRSAIKGGGRSND